MKNTFSKFLAGLVLFTSFGLTSCFKEPALEPDATFTTNLNENTAYAGESFYMYLDQSQGEFLTLFPGTSESKAYSPDDGTRAGVNINPALDSFEVTLYNNLGTFPMTLVASSVGEFGEEYLQNVYTIDITVVDNRIGFISFQYDGIEGVYSEDGSEIYFYTHDNADISEVAPVFTLSSPDATVAVDGVEQSSGKSPHDFTPDNQGIGESKTITYTVTAASGVTQEYDVKFILREASSEKKLLALTAVGWGGTKFTLSAAEESAKEVKLFYNPGSALTNVKMQADALGEYAWATNDDGEQIDILPEDDRIDILNYPVVTVVAEDGSEQEYELLLYELEELDTFNLVQAGGVVLNPVVEGTIDGNTITLKVLVGTDLTAVVPEINTFESKTLQFDGDAIESGVTEIDLTADDKVQMVHDDGTVMKTLTIVIDEVGGTE